jgi:hypothetical protein
MARREDFRRIGLLVPSSSSVQERKCPLLVQSGHPTVARQCPLLGGKADMEISRRDVCFLTQSGHQLCAGNPAVGSVVVTNSARSH